MKTTSGNLLEFEALRQLLGRYVSSSLGRRELEKVAPSTDRSGVEEGLAEVAEAMAYLGAAAQPQAAARGAAVRIRFDSFPETEPALQKLRIEGACLEAAEIFRLTELLDRASDIRCVLSAVSERFPRLARIGGAIGEFRSLLRDFAGKILADGSVADHASVALARLRRDIERQKRLIQESLERFLRTHQEDGVLQEDFVTIRNERFVVPVVAGQQRKVDGVVHGSSGSGHTLFVEPLETIALNNELVRLSEEEEREVRRILLEMTGRLRDCSAAVQRTVEALGVLELLFAKARFAADFGCVIPRFSPPSGERLLLRDARHPLLEDVLKRQRKPIVPISLTLEGGCRTLLISGPNTGGKTVTLKTAGLLVLMAQAAVPVPCAEAEFPLFDQVLADIGDNQSIQESLSTFSAHITRIRDMVAQATADSLVLLDELGRATDPEEGGALGVTVVDHFRATGAFSLASTHLLALKMYGACTEGVLNGCMGFDEHTLQPTYVLSLGIPGKSAGLDIARRLGMPQELIERARRSLGTREQEMTRFLAELHRRIEEISVHEKELVAERAALAARQESLAREWAQKEKAKLKELERRCDLVLEKFDAQARETIERIVEGAGQKRAAAQALRQVARIKRELREEMDVTVLSTKDEARQGELAGPAVRLAEGARVRLRGIREPARVRRVRGDGLIEVEAGFMKMQVTDDEILEVLPAAGEGRTLPHNVSFQPAARTSSAVLEINVIGQRAEDACEMVEKFLDNAVLAEAAEVRIVHGHGMGILKRAIADLLARNPNVERFHAAEPHQGGAGATIAQLKS